MRKTHTNNTAIGRHAVRTALSPATARAALHYDGRTGVLTWRKTVSPRVPAGRKAGKWKPKQNSVLVTLHGRTYRAAHLIWFLKYGVWPDRHLRFYDADPQNLRWRNIVRESDLMAVTPSAIYQRKRRKLKRALANGEIPDLRKIHHGDHFQNE